MKKAELDEVFFTTLYVDGNKACSESWSSGNLKLQTIKIART